MKLTTIKVVIASTLISFLSVLCYAQDTGIESLKHTSKAFASVAKKISPAVVFIRVEGTIKSENTPLTLPFGNQSPFGDEFFKRFFGEDFPGFQMQPRPGQQGTERKVMGHGAGVRLCF